MHGVDDQDPAASNQSPESVRTFESASRRTRQARQWSIRYTQAASGVQRTPGLHRTVLPRIAMQHKCIELWSSQYKRGIPIMYACLPTRHTGIGLAGSLYTRIYFSNVRMIAESLVARESGMRVA